MIFRYPGGKTLASQHLLRLLPARFSTYREPFVGGGSIFWALSPGHGHALRWINDLDPALISVYLALRDRPDDFLALCRAILPHSAADPHVQAGEQRINARLLAEFQRLLGDNNADPALRYLFLNRMSRLGRVMYDFPERTTFAHHRGWDAVWDGDLMQRAINHLQGAHVTTGDFEALFCEAGEDVVIYADPPYARPRSTNLACRLYAHEFSNDDHERLAHVAHQSSHRIIISYNDCPAVRSLYHDWHITPITWAYVGQAGERKKRGSELLICNFETTQQGETTKRARMAELGRMTSDLKAAAARQNGKKGGRPVGTPQSAEARAKISQARRKSKTT